jgi:hypothetical protein
MVTLAAAARIDAPEQLIQPKPTELDFHSQDLKA